MRQHALASHSAGQAQQAGLCCRTGALITLLFRATYLLSSHLAVLSVSVKDLGSKFHVLVCVKTFLSFYFVTFQYHRMFLFFFFHFSFYKRAHLETFDLLSPHCDVFSYPASLYWSLPKVNYFSFLKKGIKRVKNG